MPGLTLIRTIIHYFPLCLKFSYLDSLRRRRRRRKNIHSLLIIAVVTSMLMWWTIKSLNNNWRGWENTDTVKITRERGSVCVCVCVWSECVKGGNEREREGKKLAQTDMMNNFFPNSRALNSKEQHFHLSEKKIFFFLFSTKERKWKQK